MKISVITKLLVIIPAALLISSEKILAAQPSPESPPETRDAAVAKARDLVAEANARRVAYNKAAEKIRQAELQLKLLPGIMERIENFFSKVHPDDVDALPGVVAETKKLTAALQLATQSIQNAAAEAAAAQAVCKEAEDRACDYAKRSGSASEADVKTWQTEAAALVSEAAKKNGEAQAKVKAFEEASGNLQMALNALESYAEARGSLYDNERPVVDGFQVTLRIARDRAKEARDSVSTGNAAAGNVRQICQRIRQTLRPFTLHSSDTALLKQADELEDKLTDLTFPDSEEILQGVRQRLDEFAAAGKKIEASAETSGARAALLEAREAALTAAVTRTSLAGFAKNSPADAALQRASKCVAEIQFKTPEGEVVVPNLSVFESVLEMKAGLANLELNGALVAAKDKPPSKEKEFKFAGQDPGPGTKVKRGSTVSIAFYQKFEPAPTSSEPFVGTWVADSHSAKLTVNIRKEGEKYIVISSVNLGKGTITGEPLEGVVKDGKLFARRENWTGVTTVQTGAGKKGNITKGKVEELPPEKTGTSTAVFEQIGVDLRETQEELDKNGKLKSHGVIILRRQ